MNADRSLAGAGALFGALAVICGAFGAHALHAQVDAAALQTWHTAVEYQFWHALALLVVALQGRALRHARMVGSAFAVGIVLFSGSLYALALGAPRWIGAITPIGGVAFIAGWLLLTCSCLRHPER